MGAQIYGKSKIKVRILPILCPVPVWKVATGPDEENGVNIKTGDSRERPAYIAGCQKSGIRTGP